jgi:hypothetical protein
VRLTALSLNLGEEALTFLFQLRAASFPVLHDLRLECSVSVPQQLHQPP